MQTKFLPSSEAAWVASDLGHISTIFYSHTVRFSSVLITPPETPQIHIDSFHPSSDALQPPIKFFFFFLPFVVSFSYWPQSRTPITNRLSSINMSTITYRPSPIYNHRDQTGKKKRPPTESYTTTHYKLSRKPHLLSFFFYFLHAQVMPFFQTIFPIIMSHAHITHKVKKRFRRHQKFTKILINTRWG